MLATHEHVDHLDLPSWTRFAAAWPQALFVVPAPVVDQVTAAGIPAARVLAAEPDVPLPFGRAIVHPIPARHGVHMRDAYTFGEEISEGRVRYLGYVIEVGGARIYHAGDTIGYDGQADRLRAFGVDVALLPINGRDAEREGKDIVGNLSADEAAKLAASSGVDLAVPMHYEMFPFNSVDPATFVSALRRHGPTVSCALPGRYRSLAYTRPGDRSVPV